MFNKKKLEIISKKFEEKKTKSTKSWYDFLWKELDPNLPNPFKIVREFIMKKGLKLYGGLALHEHLKKFNDGLYKPYEFPDYDVFSPDAWNHAKQLCDILHKLGFDHVEAKGSILNDDHHQTYKVSIDMLYILDLTQVGCTKKQLDNQDCKYCGMSKDKKCISIFNNIPCNNLIGYNPKNAKTYTNVYNYETDSGIHPNKMFVSDPTWLKISMYRELSEPLSNPSRLSKVGTRLDLFNKRFKYDHKRCKPEEYNREVNEQFLPVLEYVGELVKKYKLVNYGATAYNFFMKGLKTKHYGNLDVSDYQVYSSKPVAHRFNIIKELERKFPDFKFKKRETKELWKEIDSENYIISARAPKGRIKYNDIIKITYSTTCMPYVQANGIRYVTVDRLKYMLYRAVSLNEVYNQITENPDNYECLLSNLLKNEKKWIKKHPKSNKHKFKRFIDTCSGEEQEKIFGNLVDRWYEKNQTLKKTKFIIDHPKPGLLTKIYPMPSEELKLPYRPDESSKKQYKKVVGNKIVSIKRSNRRPTEISKTQIKRSKKNFQVKKNKQSKKKVSFFNQITKIFQ